MGSRRVSRVLALQALYLMDVCAFSREEAVYVIIRGDDEADEKIREFAVRLVSGVHAERTAIDSLIQKYAQNWELGRMAAIDRSVLRMASFELLHEQETPISVIIDEAVEIAKQYSTVDSGKFVNGILDKVKDNRSPVEASSRLPSDNDPAGS